MSLVDETSTQKMLSSKDGRDHLKMQFLPPLRNTSRRSKMDLRMDTVITAMARRKQQKTRIHLVSAIHIRVMVLPTLMQNDFAIFDSPVNRNRSLRTPLATLRMLGRR